MKKILSILVLGLSITAYSQTPSKVSNVKYSDEPKAQGRIEPFDLSTFNISRPDVVILPIKYMQTHDLIINLGGEKQYQPESDVTKNLPYTDSRVLIIEIPKDAKLSEADLKRLNELVKKIVK